MNSAVVDASAVLASLNQEPGWERVDAALDAGGFISTVNLSEVAAKLSERGVPDHAVDELLKPFIECTVDFDATQALAAGKLRSLTKSAGLSLGDRACLALAIQVSMPALTADRTWARIETEATVEQLRS